MSDMAQRNSLSAREREVAGLVAHGKSNRAIAAALFVTERTVESHVASIYNKLNVHSRVELAGEVFRNAAAGPRLALDSVPSNNLPIQHTYFRGRQRDLAEIEATLERRSQLTLTGAGGIGKTRLALQAGTHMLGRFPDGVWFVELAPLSEPELVAEAVAQVIGATIKEGTPAEQTVAEFLRRKKLLLILDNCEHLVEASATLVDAVMRRCQEVRILATSRQSLAVNGEMEHRLSPLEFPDPSGNIRIGDAERYSALAVFTDRAQAADANFTLADDNIRAVAEICFRLDGLPLAIELAAARVKTLSIATIARHLDDRLSFLTGGSRTAQPRQQTLRGMIDWSYGLLSHEEQTFLNRLGIFAGGFSLDAAQAVCVGDGVAEGLALDLLGSLVDQSLVVVDTAGARERYDLLESIRAYALEKLTGAGERERIARRHAKHFRDEAERAAETFGAMSEAAWTARLEPEMDNFRAAIDWATESGENALAGAIVGTLGALWESGGAAVEGRRRIATALAAVDEAKHPLVAAHLWKALGWLAWGKRMYEAADRARVLYERAGDARGAARALRDCAFAFMVMNQLDKAIDANARAMAAARECGDASGLAFCIAADAMIATANGDFKKGRESCDQAIAMYRQFGNEGGIAYVLSNRAELEFASGDVEQALRDANEAQSVLSQRRSGGLHFGTLINSGAYRIAAGDLDGAYKALREGLRLAQEQQFHHRIAFAIQDLALIAARRGDVSQAARLLGYVDLKYQELGVARETTEKWGYENLTPLLHQHLTDVEIGRLAAEGAEWSEDQAVEEALKV